MTRRLSSALISASLLLTACGGGGGGGTPTPTPIGGAPTPSPSPSPTSSCSLRARQDWVLAQMREWYLFPETLPTNPDPTPFATVEA